MPGFMWCNFLCCNETKKRKLSKGTRWVILKTAESSLIVGQAKVLEELNRAGAFTCTAWKVKEKLRWIRKVTSLRSAKWRLAHFIQHICDTVGYDPILEPVFNTLATLVRYKDQIVACLEWFNSLFQVARACVWGYCSTTTFITMIYLIAAPIDILLKST